MDVLLILFCIMNLVSFILMGIDKKRAKKSKWRIPEKTLWLTALFGGALGGLLGMSIFRHKTKHLHFRIGFLVLTVLQIFLLYYFYAY